MSLDNNDEVLAYESTLACTWGPITQACALLAPDRWLLGWLWLPFVSTCHPTSIDTQPPGHSVLMNDYWWVDGRKNPAQAYNILGGLNKGKKSPGQKGSFKSRKWIVNIRQIWKSIKGFGKILSFGFFENFPIMEPPNISPNQTTITLHFLPSPSVSSALNDVSYQFFRNRNEPWLLDTGSSGCPWAILYI